MGESAYLGLATNEDLLRELSCRMEIHWPQNHLCRQLHWICEESLQDMSNDILHYRTTGS